MNVGSIFEDATRRPASSATSYRQNRSSDFLLKTVSPLASINKFLHHVRVQSISCRYVVCDFVLPSSCMTVLLNQAKQSWSRVVIRIVHNAQLVLISYIYSIRESWHWIRIQQSGCSSRSISGNNIQVPSINIPHDVVLIGNPGAPKMQKLLHQRLDGNLASELRYYGPCTVVY